MAFAAVCQAIAGLLAWNLTQNIDISGCLSGFTAICQAIAVLLAGILYMNDRMTDTAACFAVQST